MKKLSHLCVNGLMTILLLGGYIASALALNENPEYTFYVNPEQYGPSDDVVVSFSPSYSPNISSIKIEVSGNGRARYWVGGAGPFSSGGPFGISLRVEYGSISEATGLVPITITVRSNYDRCDKGEVTGGDSLCHQQFNSEWRSITLSTRNVHESSFYLTSADHRPTPSWLNTCDPDSVDYYLDDYNTQNSILPANFFNLASANPQGRWRNDLPNSMLSSIIEHVVNKLSPPVQAATPSPRPDITIPILAIFPKGVPIINEYTLSLALMNASSIFKNNNAGICLSIDYSKTLKNIDISGLDRDNTVVLNWDWRYVQKPSNEAIKLLEKAYGKGRGLALVFVNGFKDGNGNPDNDIHGVAWWSSSSVVNGPVSFEKVDGDASKLGQVIVEEIAHNLGLKDSSSADPYNLLHRPTEWLPINLIKLDDSQIGIMRPLAETRSVKTEHGSWTDAENDVSVNHIDLVRGQLFAENFLGKLNMGISLVGSPLGENSINANYELLFDVDNDVGTGVTIHNHLGIDKTVLISARGFPYAIEQVELQDTVTGIKTPLTPGSISWDTLIVDAQTPGTSIEQRANLVVTQQIPIQLLYQSDLSLKVPLYLAYRVPVVIQATDINTQERDETSFSMEIESGYDSALIGTDGTHLLSVGLSTGKSSVIGQLGSENFAGIASDPKGKELYGVTTGSPAKLYKIDQSTGGTTLISALNGSGASARIGNIAFNPDGTLYGIASMVGDAASSFDYLVVIDKETGVLQSIGQFNECGSGGAFPCTLDGMNSIAFAQDGTLIGASSPDSIGGSTKLYRIDSSNADAHLIAPILDLDGSPISGGIASLVYGCDNSLFGLATNAGRLLSIASNTGRFVYIGETPTTSGVTLIALASARPSCPKLPDQDSDEIMDLVDNCPNTANSDQADRNVNGIGDSCEVGGIQNGNVAAANIFLGRDGRIGTEALNTIPDLTNPSDLSHLIALNLKYQVDSCKVSRPQDAVVNLVDNAIRLGLTSSSLKTQLENMIIAEVGVPRDIDRDGDIDKFDVQAITSSAGKSAIWPSDPLDVDCDGKITVLDARKEVLRCTRPLCKP